MGLELSHNAFGGRYSTFNLFRQAVAKALGGSYEADEAIPGKADFFFPGGFDVTLSPGLTEFFTHSDCDGEIPPDLCRCLAEEMEPLLPRLDEMDAGLGFDQQEFRLGPVARQFIGGCREAANAGEPLEFG